MAPGIVFTTQRAKANQNISSWQRDKAKQPRHSPRPGTMPRIPAMGNILRRKLLITVTHLCNPAPVSTPSVKSSGRNISLPCESVKTISGGKTIFTVKVNFYRGQSFYRCRCRCRCREKLFFNGEIAVAVAVAVCQGAVVSQ